MSVLETPRVYFRGFTTWDPVTTNNYPRNYDEMGAQTMLTPDGKVGPFRKAAIDDVVTSGNWNPHGTYRSQFYDTTVVGVDTGSGVSTADPFVGSPVNFMGMLVDLEPYGSMSSQLFFDSMSLGIDGAPQVRVPRAMRMIARQINFARIPSYTCIAGLGSVVWQTSVPKGDGLPLAALGSPAIEALQRSLEDDDVLGLTVRWNAYRTVYYDNVECRTGNDVMKRESLRHRRRLRGGGFQPNPARSVLVGVLGLWRVGDAPQVSGDRGLLQANSGPIATATARLTGTRLVVDFGNSVPESDSETLAKTDYGTLNVQVGRTVIGTLPYSAYDKDAYEATAGIVTLELDSDGAASAASGDLTIQGADGTVYLQEERLHVCEITPNVYVDQGESATLQVQVLDRGQPAAAGTVVSWVTASTSAPTMRTSLTDANGVASLAVDGASSNMIGQIDQYVATTSQQPPTVANTMTTSYLWVRTLPSGSDVAALDPTWDNVYNSVLYNWHAMAPCMDNWLDLGDEHQVARYDAVLRKLTAKENFEAFRYMPVTRDLTAGQRSLLYAWLDSTQGLEAAESAPAPTSGPDTHATLSRSFRSG
jgi:hypothetical protein